jgi:hypothetical protein
MEKPIPLPYWCRLILSFPMPSWSPRRLVALKYAPLVIVRGKQPVGETLRAAWRAPESFGRMLRGTIRELMPEAYEDEAGDE